MCVGCRGSLCFHSHSNMRQATQNSVQDDSELQQIDHVIRLFQKARKAQSKQNIKLTLGLKNGEEFFVYSVYPSKRAPKKRNRKKTSVVPVTEETVELPEDSIPPPPTSVPSPLPQMETRQRKRRRENSNNKTPEQSRCSPQVSRANMSVLSPSSTVPLQYAVPTKNRFQNLPEILNEDSSMEDEEHTDDEHNDVAGSDRESVSSFSNCKCEEIKCKNLHFKNLKKCEFSCECECINMEGEASQGPNARHTCKKCYYFREKFKKHYPNKLSSYAEITKIQK